MKKEKRVETINILVLLLIAFSIPLTILNMSNSNTENMYGNAVTRSIFGNINNNQQTSINTQNILSPPSLPGTKKENDTNTTIPTPPTIPQNNTNNTIPEQPRTPQNNTNSTIQQALPNTGSPTPDSGSSSQASGDSSSGGGGSGGGSGSGGSGATGGSGGSSSTGTQKKEYTKTIPKIQKEVEKTITNTIPAIPVKEVTITLNKEATNVKIVMQEQPQRPASTPTIETTEITYFSITTTGIETKDIQTSEITFEVDNTILKTKNINPTSIILKRYTTTWEELPTTYKGIKEGKHTYIATTPGFSYFAITTKEEIKEKNNNTTSQETTETIVQEQPAQTTIPREKSENNIKKILIITVTIAIIILWATIYVYQKNK